MQRFCNLCDLKEREQLRSFSGGKLEVKLTAHRRPAFWEWEERPFYRAHIVKVLPPEFPTGKVVDEGFEIDGSRLNLVVYRTPQGVILVDPGYVGFEQGYDPYVGRLMADHKIIASVVTHGHLDHWNALGQTTGPVFMPRTAYRLASMHASWTSESQPPQLDSALRNARDNLIFPGKPVLLDELPVNIDTFHLPHSIPETMGLVIRGERGRAVHLGDFKFNGFGAKAKAETIARLQQIAKEPVDFLALTIYNAHVPGFVPIEDLVVDALTDIMVKAEGRVVITCFSTNLDRVLRLAKIARILGRQVSFTGAGMQNCREMIGFEETGYSGKEVAFVTGCQAEERSFLWNIAQGTAAMDRSDTLVFSSRCIPGNEERLREHYTRLRPKVGRLIVTRGEVSQLGLQGLGTEEVFTHVSGHEYGDGIRLALEILRPKKVIAWPQTSPQIEAFRKICEEVGGIEILSEDERVIDI